MSTYWKIFLLLQIGVIGVLEIYLLLKYMAVSQKLKKMYWQSSGDGIRSQGGEAQNNSPSCNGFQFHLQTQEQGYDEGLCEDAASMAEACGADLIEADQESFVGEAEQAGMKKRALGVG